MWRAFKKFREVGDIYMAHRRMKNGKIFGFVRFRNVVNESSMERNLNKMWIGTYKVRVFMANKYEKKENMGSSKAARQKKEWKIKRGLRIGGQPKIGSSAAEAMTTINAVEREGTGVADFGRHGAAIEVEETALNSSNPRRMLGVNDTVEVNNGVVESGPRRESNPEETSYEPNNGREKEVEQHDELDPIVEKIKKVGLSSGCRPINMEDNFESGDNFLMNVGGCVQSSEVKANHPSLSGNWIDHR
ncbi:hypothetical protein L6452_43987 [Arctium lappa]|uniref:Uncharacterized protein n=1 Tax=Arctium lappa TaxID=4217 RepID=A0ACB8XF57_ARCLA|nr:hypothetical protein L6452_43987 [Arctium lappa]